jgi:pimeloyl-ACP methyl ester carboxylesterase
MLLGERDQMAPAKNTRALIAALDSPIVMTIPGCGHSLMAEAPDAVLDALRGFMQQPAEVGP